MIAQDSVPAAEAPDLALSLLRQGRLDEAIAIYRAIIRAAPDNALAHYHLAQVLLLKGDWLAGWRELEWRWPAFLRKQRDYGVPLWDGRPLSGDTIFLHAEQGLGDSIQFIRYVPLVAARGGRVVVGCKPRMRRLFAPVDGVSQVVVSGEAVPPFTVHLPFLSLPGVFRTTPATVPDQVPYLRAEPERVEAWRGRIEALPRPRIGLCWQGNPNNPSDRHRSIPLARLERLMDGFGGTFVGLQAGPGREQAAGLRPGRPFVDLGAELEAGADSFVDDAAILHHLDLVITVDTAIAHLAGALARPVWVLLARAPDWRWLMDREDSPWYPSMRLFRQPAQDDWDSVIALAGEALAAD